MSVSSVAASTTSEEDARDAEDADDASRDVRAEMEAEANDEDDDDGGTCVVRVRAEVYDDGDSDDGDGAMVEDDDAPETYQSKFVHTMRATSSRAFAFHEDGPPSKEVVHHDALGAFRKVVVSGSMLVALSCTLAGCLTAYERPYENEMHARMSTRQAAATRAITELFECIDESLTRGLTVDVATPSCAESYRGYLLPEVTEDVGKRILVGLI